MPLRISNQVSEIISGVDWLLGSTAYSMTQYWAQTYSMGFSIYF